MKRTIYITLCALLPAAMATAQSMVTFSLDDCLREAVANNIKLRNADNTVLMATEQRKEALTKFFPTVSASAAGIAADRHLIQMDMGGMGVGLVKHGVTASVTAMQPLFAGGQIVNANRLAKVGEEASRLQRALTADEVRLGTETYYWQTVQLREKLRTLDRMEAQVENARRDAEAAVEAGVRNRNDLLQVTLRKNEIRTSRISLENSLSVVSDLLGQYTGHAGDSIALTSPFDGKEGRYSLPASPAALYVAPETALAQTNEYQLLGRQAEAERLQYRLAVGKNLPSVAVGGAYVYNDLMDKPANRLVGMLTVSVPLSQWWGGSHDMRRQKLKAQNAEGDLHDQGELLVIRMRKAWHGMTDAYRQLEVAMESIEQSEENLRLNTDYYKAGTATVSDLLDAQTLYQQSRDKYVEAYTRYEVSRREYLQATGR